MFKVGDEVVCVREGKSPLNPTMKGQTYIVSNVFWNPLCGEALILKQTFSGGQFKPPGFSQKDWFWGHSPDRFRKVQRRNLTEWLKTAAKDDETKHIDKSVKERA